jgi:hypothetical protein
MDPLKALDSVLGRHSIGCTGSEWLSAAWYLPESKVYVFWQDKTELHLTVDKGKQECKRLLPGLLLKRYSSLSTIQQVGKTNRSRLLLIPACLAS